MSNIKALKAQATQMQQALSRMGIAVTRAQALEALAAQYGQPNWDTLCALADTAPMVVPEVVKSTKGCQLLLLTSGDGAQYDRHAIVPAHLDAQAIANELTAEIQRLKKLDDELFDAGRSDGYTDADLKTFLEKRGCTWVEKPVSPAENWD